MKLEPILTASFLILAAIGSALIIRHNWRRYGLLFLLSAAVALIICYLFVQMGFYAFPYRLFPQLFLMPVEAISVVFPFLVLVGVRYSPRLWVWKIPVYWTLVHIGMTGEAWAQNATQLIRYERFWDVWDSYTWWWIYLLVFEWLGGKIVPEADRKPLSIKQLQYGSLGWFLLHGVLILTIFLAGYYVAWRIHA